MDTSNGTKANAENSRTHTGSRKRLLRRPCTGWHRRLLRARCGSQVERRKRLWMRFSTSTRRASEGRMLHLVGQRRSYPQES